MKFDSGFVVIELLGFIKHFLSKSTTFLYISLTKTKLNLEQQRKTAGVILQLHKLNYSKKSDNGSEGKSHLNGARNCKVFFKHILAAQPCIKSSLDTKQVTCQVNSLKASVKSTLVFFVGNVSQPHSSSWMQLLLLLLLLCIFHLLWCYSLIKY